MLSLTCGDFRDVLLQMPPVKMIFADPPDNIGLDYETYEDNLQPLDYASLISDIFWTSFSKCQVLWISFNVKHLLLFSHIADNFLIHTGWSFKPCVQTYTFYQHNKHDLGSGHRPLWRFMAPETPLYSDAIRVPSWRLLNGDPRANPEGKVPSDVFDFPRVVGNSKQRRRWHKTQLNEDLYERCVKQTTLPSEEVCDIFAGTGTLARVCAKTGNPCHLIELDKKYCENIALEHNLQQVNENHWRKEL